ncbi:MAG: AsmA-like C-terminal region-containing protein [Ignavibacteria bacterium]
MKKPAIITGVIIFVLLLLMVITPIFFKGNIEELVKKEANKRLNASLNFESTGISMFKSFPDLTLSIDNFTIVSKEPFKGDTLISASSFQVTVNLWSAVSKNIKVEAIKIVRPKLNIKVLRDSTANYMVIKPDTANPSKGSAMNVSLKKYTVEDGQFIYEDQTSDIFVVMKNLNHTGSGDFSQNRFDLLTKTTVEAMNLEFKGISYLKNVATTLDMDIDADIAAKKFTFKKNELHINNLILKLDGYFAKPDTNISMDINFESARTDFKDIVSLIPSAYSSKDFSALKSSGKMLFKGNARGIYNKSGMPAFNIRLMIQNGYFQYPKLPTPVKDVNMDLNIMNPGQTPDQTVINLKLLHFVIGNEPFDGSLLVKTPKSNPYIDMRAKGRINLAQLKSALPLEDISKLEGIVQADFQARGNLGDVKKNQLANVQASGTTALNNFAMAGKKLPQEIKINQALLKMNTQFFALQSFSMTIGQSDISAEGSLSNMLGYLFNKGTISGSLNVNSSLLDLNKLMPEQPKNQQPTDNQVKSKAVELPERVEFTMNSNFSKVIFQNLELQNVRGVIKLKDKKLSMDPLNMNLLGGSLTTNGFYYTPDKNTQNISFNLSVNNFDIGKTYENFVTVRQFAPMAKYIHGNFDTKLRLATSLSTDMTPVWNSFNSQGALSLARAEVKDFKPFEMIGNTLKINELKNPLLENIKPSFTITDGKFTISPFNFKVYNCDITFSGSNGIDKTLDYAMNIQIPAEKLQTQANQAINKLLKRDANLSTGKINVKALIKGRIEQPVVTTSATDIAGQAVQSVADQAKQQVTQEVQKQKDQVQKQIEQKIDTLKNQIQKKAADKLNDLFKKRF